MKPHYLATPIFITLLSSAQRITDYKSNERTVAGSPSSKVLYEDQVVRAVDFVVPEHSVEPSKDRICPSILILRDAPGVNIEGITRSSQRLTASNRFVAISAATSEVGIVNGTAAAMHAIRIIMKHPGVGSAPIPAGPEDALLYDPSDVKLVFENADVRVLEISIEPNTTIGGFTHVWPAIIYTDLPAKLQWRTPGGSSSEDHIFTEVHGITRAPSERYHSLENIGDDTYHQFRIELKHPQPPGA